MYLKFKDGKKIMLVVLRINLKSGFICIYQTVRKFPLYLLKAILQSGSLTEIDPNTGKLYGQSALGQWLLVDVLGLRERQPVTREWLEKKGTDSVRLWRKKDDYSTINIDFAPIGSFETFMKDEINNSDD